MRTLILFVALVSFAGCSSAMKKSNSEPYVPRTRKALTVAQRRMDERGQTPALGDSRTEVNGVVVR